MSVERPQAASTSWAPAQPVPGPGEEALLSPSRRSLSGGAATSALSRGIVTVAAAATTVAMAHLLAPRAFGAYSVALTLTMLLVVLTTLGAEHGVVYYVSAGRWSGGEALRELRWLALVCGGVGIAGVTVVRLLLPRPFHGLTTASTLVAAASLPFALGWFYSSYVWLALERYEEYGLLWAVQALLALGLSAGLAAAGGLVWAVAGLAFSHLLTAVLAAARRGPAEEAPGGAPAARSARIGQAVAFGIKGYVANALQIINYRLDVFILNATVAGAVVGHYAVAVAVTGVLWVLPQALSDVVFPRVAALTHAGEDPDLLLAAEARVLRHAVLVTLLGSGAVALALAFLLVPVFGTSFRSSVGLGFILLPGCALLGIANPLSSMIVGRGHPGSMLKLALVVTPATIGLYAGLIPALHAEGAALASTLSYAGAFGLAGVVYRRRTGANPLRQLVPTRAELSDYRSLARRLRRAGA